MHLIADTQYEVPAAMHVTPASASEQIELRAMLGEMFEKDPELTERCADFSADHGLDSTDTKVLLGDENAIRPLIDTRELWREEKQQPDYNPSQPIPRPLYPKRVDTIVYTEKDGVALHLSANRRATRSRLPGSFSLSFEVVASLPAMIRRLKVLQAQ